MVTGFILLLSLWLIRCFLCSMLLAIHKAETSGVGWVSCRGSNHFGICQWYTQIALNYGMVRICTTNTSPLVAPSRSKEGIFGTNPISIATARMDGDSFLLDMSTLTVAVGKIEIQVCGIQEIVLAQKMHKILNPVMYVVFENLESECFLAVV